MGKINSKDKGRRGERELASKLRELGFNNCRRGQQYNGIEGDDVIGLPNIHIEVKRVEKLNIYDAIEQAIRDAKEKEFPVVFHRKNNKKWLVTLPIEDFIEIYKESEYSEERKEE